MGALQASFEWNRARLAPSKLLRAFFGFVDNVINRVILRRSAFQFKQGLFEVKNIRVQRSICAGVDADCRVEGAKREGDFEA